MRTPRRWWRECERLGLGHSEGECVFCGSISLDRIAYEVIMAATKAALYTEANRLLENMAALQEAVYLKDLKES